jgi:hypothetical protein
MVELTGEARLYTSGGGSGVDAGDGDGDGARVAGTDGGGSDTELPLVLVNFTALSGGVLRFGIA